jgi:drug/metabolite transporter (DMT)-like permease
MSLVFGFIIGIIAYVLLFLGKGIQKYAIEGLKVDKTIKSKNSGLWIFGLILTTSFMFIQWAALIFAPINLIAPLQGLGLIVLMVFSHYVLKEAIQRIQLLGVILIITGTIIITLFNPNTGEISAEIFNFGLYMIFSLSIIGGALITVIISKINNWIAAGLILGAISGIFSAFQTSSKRITAIPDEMITLFFTGITFIMAIFTLLTTQFAFTKANANIVVPCYTAISIPLAVFTGVIALNEIIEFVQIIGIILIIVGVIFLTAFTIEEENGD